MEVTMKRIAALLLLAWLSTQDAFAFDTFTVSDIRSIDGLSRIAPGTVFTYLPVEKGDTLTSRSCRAGYPRPVQDRLFQRRHVDPPGQYPCGNDCRAPGDLQVTWSATRT